MQSRQAKSHSPNTAPTKATEVPQKVTVSATSASRVPAWASVSGNQPPVALQAKLTINEPGDIYEQEADRVADQVIRMPDASATIQRKCACGGTANPTGECEECAKKRMALQRKSTQSASDTTAPAIVNSVLSSSGTPMDASTRSFMEPRFGHDFSDVRIHTDAQATESAQAVNALAYTAGSSVVFGAGQYRPGTSEGQKLLAHELTHVVQQGATPQSVQRQTAPGTGATSPTPASAQANSSQPNPRLTLQIPISPLNFQLPIGGSANVFMLPPVGMRNQNFDQVWQPNIAAGLNLSFHSSDTGIEIGLFAQGGLNFSLNSGDLPSNQAGTRQSLTGYNFQGYLQPAWVFLSDGPHQLSAILQPGAGRTWSDIPGIQGTSVTAQGGLQYTYNLLQNRLQITGALLIGYNMTWADQPPAGITNPQGNWFTGISIALQPVIPLLNWPPESAHQPSHVEDTPGRPQLPPPPEQQQERQQPVQQPEPTPPSVPTQPIPASVPYPTVSEIFFYRDKPSLDAQGSATLSQSLTPEGSNNLTALIQRLQTNPNLKVELVGMASVEGSVQYNLELASRRVELIANALGVDISRITRPIERDIRDECDEVRPGIYNCGARIADRQVNSRDRKVMALVFTSSS